MADFRQTQQSLASWLRDPDGVEPPANIEARRLKIYQDLVFNNVEGFLSSGFPVCRKLFADTEWLQLVRDFIRDHRCQTPFFHEISQEFIVFLRGRETGGRPWLAELAHYEWVELDLDISPDESVTSIDADGDLLSAVPVLAACVRPLVYQWPVHLIGPDNIPQLPSAQPIHLLVYRNPAEVVEFMSLNPATARLLAIVADNAAAARRSGAELIRMLAEEMSHPDPQALQSYGHELLQDFKLRGVVAGTIMPK